MLIASRFIFLSSNIWLVLVIQAVLKGHSETDSGRSGGELEKGVISIKTFKNQIKDNVMYPQ